MNLIIETDIGHDPDDLFSICYLVAAGVDIRAILVVPGDPDQIAIAKLITNILGLDIPVGSSKLDRKKLSSGSIHHKLLDKYGHSLEANSDGLGVDILEDVIESYPDSELFAIGPVTSIGKYLLKNPLAKFNKATMQGGFLSYALCEPNIRLDKFEGLDGVPTFNLNGDRPAGELFMNANIAERRMVGKNVCHTVEFNKEIYNKHLKKNGSPAADLFCEAAEMYFEKHESKKFHDPTAACLHLHPEIGSWYLGKTVKIGNGWGTVPGNDKILGNINYELLWEHLLTFNPQANMKK